jgi:hypothetical protein
VWGEEGPFQVYNIDNRGPQNIPYEFNKTATWTIIDRVKGYYARSLLEMGVEVGRYYPVEFNFTHCCWVEVHPQENEEFGQFWQAHRTAATDLGLDITEAEVELHHTLLTPHNNEEEEDSMHTMSSPCRDKGYAMCVQGICGYNDRISVTLRVSMRLCSQMGQR